MDVSILDEAAVRMRNLARLLICSRPSPSQKVDAAIVSDAKEPRAERPSVVERVQLAIGLEQRFLLESEGVRFKGRKVDMPACQFRFPAAKKAPKATAKRTLPRKSYR